MMEEKLDKELCFVIAKYLKSKFPNLATSFIKECEANKLFPSSIFSENPTFDQLEKSLKGIPNEQLLELVCFACPSSSKNQSLLFSIPKPNQALKLGDNIEYQIHDFKNCITEFRPVIRNVGHYKPIYCLAFDNTSQIVITGSDDYVIKVWSLKEYSLMKTYFIHKNVITDISIDPTNNYFASSSHDFTIGFFSLINGTLIKKLKFTCEIHMIKFSPCGKYLAAACQNGFVQVYKVDDIINNKNPKPFIKIETQTKESAAWLDFSPGSEFIAFSADPNSLSIYSFSKNCMISLEGHTNLPEFLSFSKKSCKYLISLSSKEKQIRIWKAAESKWETEIILTGKNLQSNINAKFLKCFWNCDESRIVAISSHAIYVWETNKYELLLTISHELYTNQCSTLSVNPKNPKYVFVSCVSGVSAIWNIFTGKLVKILQENEFTKITESRWSPDGQSIVAADAAAGITIFNTNKRSFETLEQFFPKETDNVYDETQIYDSKGVPLLPQPKILKLEDLKLGTVIKPIPQKVLIEEKKIAEQFIKENKTKKENINEETDDNFLEGEEEDISSETNEENDYSVSENSFVEDEESYSEMEDYSDFESDDSSSDPIIRMRTRNQSKMIYGNSPNNNDTNSTRKSPRKKNINDEDRDFYIRIQNIRKPNVSNSSSSDHQNENELSQENNNEVEPKNETNSDQESYKDVEENEDSEFTDEELQTDEENTNDEEFQENTNDEEYIGEDSAYEEEQFEKAKNITKRKKKSRPKPKKTDTLNNSEEEDIDNLENSPKQKIDVQKEEKEIDNVPSVMPEWTREFERLQSFYIPQLNERIVYFKKGHMLNSKLCHVSEFKAPYQQSRSLKTIEYGTITNLEFYVDYYLITILFDNGINSIIYYPLPDAPCFIVSEEDYKKSEAKFSSLSKGATVSIIYFENDQPTIYNAIVDSFSENRENDPFNSINIKFSKNDENITPVSPWELYRNREKRSNLPIYSVIDDFIPFINQICVKEKYSSLNYLRDNDEYLIKKSIKPVDLTLIVDRLNKYWYQTPDELVSDINLIAKNVNPKLKDVVKLAEELKTTLLKHLQTILKRNHLDIPSILKI